MDNHRIQLISTVITRLPLKPSHICLFKAFYEVANNWISISELAYRIQDDESSMSGILGSLGNRINQTEGIERPYDGYGLLMAWETYHDELHYRGLPELRTVIERFPVLQNTLNLSVDEIHRLHKDGLAIF